MNVGESFLGAVLLITAGCVSQERFDFLQHQYNTLQAEHERLKAEGIPAGDEVKALQAKLEECAHARSAALASVTRLRYTENELRKQLRRAREGAEEAGPDPGRAEEIERIRTAWDALNKEREALEAELAARHEKIQLMENQIQRLEQELSQAREAARVDLPAGTTRPVESPATKERVPHP